MSWEATAWARRQKTGHTSRKTILLLLADHADENGYCWPSQEKLADDSELSVDTIQRQSRRLQEMGLIRVERLPKRRGQWQGFCYWLNLSKETSRKCGSETEPHSGPQNAARSSVKTEAQADSGDTERAAAVRPGQAALVRPGRAATDGVTGPQSLRHKSPLEPSNKSSPESSVDRASFENAATAAADRLRAFQGKQEGAEVVQNRIARRLGADGWLILGDMSDAQRARLTTLERRGQLDGETLADAVAESRRVRPP